LLSQGELGTLLSISALRDAWFGRFWAWAAPGVRETAETKCIPLLRGHTRAGRVLTAAEVADSEQHGGLTPPVSGTVLEIGPGSGMWVSMFKQESLWPSDSITTDASKNGGSVRRRGAEPGERVTRVYGVEPNPDVHAALRQQVPDAGLEGTYEILPMGIEDLAASGKVAKESVDSIVSILCLCGIPEPRHNLRELYGYLKPGGRMYVYEHVKCSNHWLMIWYQGKWKVYRPAFAHHDLMCSHNF